MILLSTVSGNASDFSFDGINIVDGLQRLKEYFVTLNDTLPSFGKIGQVFNVVLSAFPAKYWFAMIIFVICLTLARILRRY